MEISQGEFRAGWISKSVRRERSGFCCPHRENQYRRVDDPAQKVMPPRPPSIIVNNYDQRLELLLHPAGAHDSIISHNCSFFFPFGPARGPLQRKNCPLDIMGGFQ